MPNRLSELKTAYRIKMAYGENINIVLCRSYERHKPRQLRKYTTFHLALFVKLAEPALNVPHDGTFDLGSLALNSCHRQVLHKNTVFKKLNIFSSPGQYMKTPSCCTIFSTLSDKWQDFRKNVLNIKYVLNFSTNFAWNISHCKKNSAINYHKCT